ncbi:MAG: bifunctional methylenetetrahydrofolate dehydrogenase/methenyltetrahydrofolate cyclohydrolase FolD [Deltaproteobacteria bacterium]|nr:bifunctional methylenetetrahydrofolate dehydrogenase/methenyltetrahydrofolate cyclohydrolase FolD [Deltaproteobacteria bacterium]
MGQILDGKRIAESLRATVARAAADFTDRMGRPPGLEVVLVGEDPASSVYVRNKARACEAAGIRGVVHTLPASTSEQALIARVHALNEQPNVDGILVQLPVPAHIEADRVFDAVDAAKDVDGFHPLNAGLLFEGRAGLVPCTPWGCMRLLDAAQIEVAGKHAVVVGRSNIVGKPAAMLLLQRSATVTMAHSKTRNLPALCRDADILIAAVGRPEMIRGDWIKPGAVVLDVGINRNDESKLVGDVAFAEALEVAAFVTPVPGGVGPMTIACLLENTVRAAWMRAGLPPSELKL